MYLVDGTYGYTELYALLVGTALRLKLQLALFGQLTQTAQCIILSKLLSLMLKKLSEKLGAKLPATTPEYSMLKITGLDDAFSEVFLTASKPSRRSITAAKKKRKGEKGKAKKNSKNRKALRRRSLSLGRDTHPWFTAYFFDI